MHDPEAFAEMVVLTIKSALAPVLERLAVSEQSNRDLQARVLDLSGLRDRVTLVEAKAAVPAVEAPSVDFGPVLERIAAAEARLSTLGDVRDRVMAVETKAAVVPVLSPDVTDRIAAVEARVSAAELRMELRASDTTPILASLADLTKDLGTMRERVAVVEVRGQMPGPAGKDGEPGKDGADGLGFDDLTTVQNDDRSFTVKAQRGDRVKDIGTARFPVQIQRGVYIEGKSYEVGDLVTWGGSQWHCDEQTSSKPGDGSKAWTLVVKRGRDGKDGRDAVAVPVVSIGRQA